MSVNVISSYPSTCIDITNQYTKLLYIYGPGQASCQLKVEENDDGTQDYHLLYEWWVLGYNCRNEVIMITATGIKHVEQMSNIFFRNKVNGALWLFSDEQDFANTAVTFRQDSPLVEHVEKYGCHAMLRPCTKAFEDRNHYNTCQPTYFLAPEALPHLYGGFLDAEAFQDCTIIADGEIVAHPSLWDTTLFDEAQYERDAYEEAGGHVVEFDSLAEFKPPITISL